MNTAVILDIRYIRAKSVTRDRQAEVRKESPKCETRGGFPKTPQL